MLDPHIRRTLKPSETPGVWTSGPIRLPDRYGVFTWRVQTEDCPGQSHIAHAFTLPIVPFRHDEYDRFLPAAYPYYTAVFVMMAVWTAMMWIVHATSGATPAAVSSGKKLN